MVNGYAVSLLPGKDGDEGNVGKRVFSDKVFSVCHLSIQGVEVFSEFFFGLFWLLPVQDLVGRSMNSCVAEVYPDPRVRPLAPLFGHERDVGILFFQVFVDDSGFVDDRIAVNEHRHLGVRVQLQEFLGFVLEVDLDQLIGKLFFCQDDPRPVRVRSGVAGIYFHSKSSNKQSLISLFASFLQPVS